LFGIAFQLRFKNIFALKKHVFLVFFYVVKKKSILSEKHHIFVLKLILFKVNLRLSLSFSAVFILVHRVLVAKTDRRFTERSSLKKLM